MRQLRSQDLLHIFIFLLWLALMGGCKHSGTDPTPNPVSHEQINVRGEITKNTTWTANNQYILRGHVYVTSGAILTIEPGTIIKAGKEDTLLKPSTLIIEAGSKIIANGTAEKPIIFTSIKEPGKRDYGDWGGLVVIGKAPHNRPAATAFNEGVRGELKSFNEPNDNSGSIQFVRIEYAGAAACCADMSSLSFYGVGSGTAIDHVQISYSGDDSFEWYGGTVNARHLISFRAFDDDFDMDWGYTGKVQFGFALRDPQIGDQSGSNCIESDNFAGTGEHPGGGPMSPNDGLPLTQPIFANISGFAFADKPLVTANNGSGSYQSAIHIRRNSATSVINSVFTGWPEGLRLDGTLTGTWQNVVNGNIELQGISLANVGGTPLLYGPGLTKPVRGAAEISDEQALVFFNASARRNEITPLTDIASILLDPATFKLDAPRALPLSNSPLLNKSVQSVKLADTFFVRTNYRGAFGTIDWTAVWTNWSPQTTEYGFE